MRRASKLDPKSPGPTPKIPLTAIASESRGLKSLPVPVEAAAQGLEKMVLQLVTRVQMLEDMLQSEVRERYRLELVVQRLSEGCEYVLIVPFMSDASSNLYCS